MDLEEFQMKRLVLLGGLLFIIWTGFYAFLRILTDAYSLGYGLGAFVAALFATVALTAIIWCNP
jgi:hypothetical protein